MSDRFYSFKCICYCNLGQLEECLTHKDINHYAYILHDKDTKEGGELKEAHIHLLVTFKQQKSIASARRIFTVGDENCLAKPIEDLVHDFRYLTHKDNEDKYQYSDENVTIDSEEYWARVVKDEVNDNTAETFLNDLCDPKLTYREMAIRYGRDYMKNYRAYHQFAETMLRDEWIRGNINIEYSDEVSTGDLKSKYTNPSYEMEKDETIYSWERFRRCLKK